VNKILIAAAFFAVTTLFGSGAQAGFNVRLAAPAGFSTVEKAGCGGGYRRSYRKRNYSSVRRAKRRAYLAAKKKAAARQAAARRLAAKKAAAQKAARLAKAEAPKTVIKDEAPQKVAKAENSSIATSKGKVAEAKPAKAEGKVEKVAAARDLDCKQFFPSVGMTLSVPCDQAK
jgi:hypothetical protein